MSRNQKTNKKASVEYSAGGVVVRRIDDDIHVLLINDPYGKWGLPKGHLEGEENSEAAALREVREETGLVDLDLGPKLGRIDWYFRAKGRLIHKFCDFYLVRSRTGEPAPELAEGITECRWLPIGEAMEVVTYQNARDVIAIADGLLKREVTEAGFEV